MVICARLAQSVKHETLNLRVVGSSPTLGENFFYLDAKSDMQSNYGNKIDESGGWETEKILVL